MPEDSSQFMCCQSPYKTLILSVMLIIPLTAKLYARNLLPAGIQSADDKTLLTKCDEIYHIYLKPADSLQAQRITGELLQEARSKNHPPILAGCLGIEADYLLEKGTDKDSLRVISDYEQALKIARQQQRKTLTAYFEYKTGRAYYQYHQYQKGIEHLFAAAALLNEIGVDQIPAPEQYLFYMGNVYCDFRDYQHGLHYLREALKYPSSDADYIYNLYGTLGLAYFKLQKNDTSVFYSKRAMEAAYSAKDTIKAGSMSGNIGAAYFELKDYENALHYLRIDYNTSISRQNWASAAGSVFFIASVYNKLGQTDNAERYLDTMRYISETHNCNNINALYSYYGLRTVINKQRKNYEQALIMQDSFLKYNDLLRENRNAATLREAELKTSKDLAETKIRLAEDQRKRQILFRNGIILVALLIIIIIAQLLYRLRQKQKSERNILTLQLQNAEKQLSIYIENLREKTRLLEQLDIKPAATHEDDDDTYTEDATTEDTDATDPEKTDTLNKLKDVTLITEEAWKEFSALVNIVHKDFLLNLKKKYPNLTPGDIRLLTLIKLDFSRQEMAATLGISPDSVKKARQRVRKKIDIDEHTDIKSVLSSF
ncbi:tetratricopeptide repeat protein [Chitinophagaceae bacterium MMS25-I14]